MIQSIVSSGPYLIIDNGIASNYHITINYEAENAGAMRWSNSGTEVFNGYTWQRVNAALPNVKMSDQAITAINWALSEMQKQKHRKDKAQAHPALANAHAAIERAEEQFDMLSSLIDSNNDQ